jgi:hypothetical protein
MQFESILSLDLYLIKIFFAFKSILNLRKLKENAIMFQKYYVAQRQGENKCQKTVNGKFIKMH